MPFAFAHLSDPHLPLPSAGIGELLSKRALGWFNWKRKRRYIHRPEALQTVVNDIRQAKPEHVALTGDLANVSLPTEFLAAAEWLAHFGSPDWISISPGNHDSYVSLPWSQGLGRWAAYMTGDGARPPASPADFPFVRQRGPVAFVGLSTAVPTAPGMATGRLGTAQLARAEGVLRALKDADLCRVVLIHHPPHEGGAIARKGLSDGAALRAMLGRVGADLVLHGHNHRSELGRIAGPRGDVPVLGVVTASAAPGGRYGAGGWHRIEVERDGDRWRFGVDLRVVATGGGCRSDGAFVVAGPAA